LNDPARSKGGGSVNLAPKFSETKDCRAGTTYKAWGRTAAK